MQEKTQHPHPRTIAFHHECYLVAVRLPGGDVELLRIYFNDDIAIGLKYSFGNKDGSLCGSGR